MVIYITPDRTFNKCQLCGEEAYTIFDNGMCWDCTKYMAGQIQEEAGEVVFIKDTTIFPVEQ